MTSPDSRNLSYSDTQGNHLKVAYLDDTHVQIDNCWIPGSSPLSFSETHSLLWKTITNPKYPYFYLSLDDHDYLALDKLSVEKLEILLKLTHPQTIKLTAGGIYPTVFFFKRDDAENFVLTQQNKFLIDLSDPGVESTINHLVCLNVLRLTDEKAFRAVSRVGKGE